MGQAVFSNNTTIYNSGGGTDSTTGTKAIYTASGWSILSVSSSSGNSGTVTVGSAVFQFSSSVQIIYVPSSTTVTLTATTGTAYASWVIFANSP